MNRGKARYMQVANEVRPGLVCNLGISMLLPIYYPNSFKFILPFLSFLPPSLFSHFFLVLPFIRGISYLKGYIDIIYHNPINLQMEKTKVQIR